MPRMPNATRMVRPGRTQMLQLRKTNRGDVMRYTGKCVCGATLEDAWNPDLKIVFKNCFKCFQIYERFIGKEF